MVVAVSPYKAKQSATSRDAIASSPVTTGANFYHTKAQSAALDVAGGAILPEAGTKQLALPQKAVAAPLVAVPSPGIAAQTIDIACPAGADSYWRWVCWSRARVRTLIERIPKERRTEIAATLKQLLDQRLRACGVPDGDD